MKLRASLIFCLCLVTSVGAQNDPRLMLEEGIYRQSTLGDYERALESYQRILRHPKVGKRTQGQALVQMAQCYDGLGEALTAMQRYRAVAKSHPRLKDSALERESEVLVSLLEDEEFLDAVDVRHLGNLLIGLQGAIAHQERARGEALMGNATEVLASMQSTLEDGPDTAVIQDQLLAMKKLQSDPTMTALQAFPLVEALTKRPKQDDSASVFAFALVDFDSVARALNADDSQTAETELTSLERYLKPITRLPERMDARVYGQLLLDGIAAIRQQLAQSDFSAARAAMDQLWQRQYDEGGMHPFDCESMEWNNQDSVSYLAVMEYLLWRVGQTLRNDRLLKAKALLSDALTVAVEFSSVAAGTFDEDLALLELAALRDMQKALNSGNVESVKFMLAPIEIDE